jgi:hypothetical protein
MKTPKKVQSGIVKTNNQPNSFAYGLSASALGGVSCHKGFTFFSSSCTIVMNLPSQAGLQFQQYRQAVQYTKSHVVIP